MVYRLAKPKRKGLGWFLRVVVMRRLIFLAVLFGVIHLVIPAEFYTISPMAIGVALVLLLLLDALSFRLQAKNADAIGTQFLTLTEAGMLVESEESGVRKFVPWTRVNRGWLRQGMLMVQEEGGLYHLLPTESLSRERAEEMLAYVNAHAGKKVAAPLPPPAALVTEVPIRVSAGKAQWNEYVDYLYKVSLPGSQVCGYIVLAALSAPFAICLVDAEPLLAVFLLLLIVCFLYLLLHPGCLARSLRKSPRPGWMHVSSEGMLALGDSGAWCALPSQLFDSALQMRHGIIYRAYPHVIALCDSIPTPPPYLPQPCRPRRWQRVAALTLALVVLPVVSAVSFLGLQMQTSMREYNEACERGAELARYVEELLPPQEYPGHLECLYFADSGILFMEWECGLEADLILDDEIVSDVPAEETSGEEK